MKNVYLALCIVCFFVACTEKAETDVKLPAEAAPPLLQQHTTLNKIVAPAGFPSVCQRYLDRVTACADTQTGAIAVAIRAGAEQSRVEWTQGNPDSSELAETCEASLKAFSAQALALKC